MHSDNLHLWTHRHVFGQDRRRAGERRTLLVIALTAATMVLEISTGIPGTRLSARSGRSARTLRITE